MKTKTPTAKIQALRQSGTLHPRPGNIQDRLFLEESFFDPQDLTQVRYEMLRRVQKDEMPISTVAASFGVSRPAFYKAQRDFARGGLAGLIPRRRGPKQGHKLTGEVLAFVNHIRAEEPDMTTPEVVRRIQKKFSFQVHRRTLERALESAKKNRTSHSCREGMQALPSGDDSYRALRKPAQLRACSEQFFGFAAGDGALMSRGMAAWMQVVGELMASARSLPVRSTETASVPQLVLDEVIQLMGSAVMTLVTGGSL